MAKTNWQDRTTEEMKSTHINGLQDAVRKIEDALNIAVVAEAGIALSEVYISSTDRYRLYQAAAGKRNWLLSPATVVKKNGDTIATGFTIDYGGGALEFSPTLIVTDAITVDATYITGGITPCSQAEAEAGIENTKIMTPLRTLQSMTLNTEVKNHIINGNMEIAQRGTVFGASTTVTTTNGDPTLTSVSSLTGIYVGMVIVAAGVTAGTTVTAIASATSITMSANATASATVTAKFNALNGLYHLDRIRTAMSADGGTHPNIVVSQIALTAGDSFGKYYGLQDSFDGAGSSLGNASSYGHTYKIEFGTRMFCGVGKTVTFSLYAKSSIAGKKIGVFAGQDYGTGGSPTSIETITGSSVTLSTTLTKYSWTFTTNTLDGKTFGTNNDDAFQILIRSQWGSTLGTAYGLGLAEGLASGTVLMTGLELVEGNVARSVIRKSYPDELLACQRYYETSYTSGVRVNGVSSLGAIASFANTTGVLQGSQFKVRKRIPPVVVVYSPGGTTSKVWTQGDVDCANIVSVHNVGTMGYRYLATSGLTATTMHTLHYMADAEL